MLLLRIWLASLSSVRTVPRPPSLAFGAHLSPSLLPLHSLILVLYFRKVLELDLFNWVAHLNLASAFYELHRDEEAAMHTARAVHLHPEAAPFVAALEERRKLSTSPSPSIDQGDEGTSPPLLLLAHPCLHSSPLLLPHTTMG